MAGIPGRILKYFRFGVSAATIAVAASSGSGSFSAPVYTGSGSSESGESKSSGSGSFTAPSYTGSGSQSVDFVDSSASGSFEVPVYAATSTAVISGFSSSSSGMFSVPVYTGSGSPLLISVTSSASAESSVPTYSATGTPTLTAIASLGSGSLTVPVYTATGTANVSALANSGSGSFTAPTFTGTGSPSLDSVGSSGVGSVVNLLFTGTGSSTVGLFTSSAFGAFLSQSYSGDGASVLEPVVSSGSGVFIVPVYTGTGSFTVPSFESAGSESVNTATATVVICQITAMENVMQFEINSTDQWLPFRVLSAGLPVTGLQASDFTSIGYSANGGESVAYTLSDGDLGDPHSEGMIVEVGAGEYQLALEDDCLTALGVVTHAISCSEAENVGIPCPITVSGGDGGVTGPGSRPFAFICEVDGSPAAGVKVHISTDSPWTVGGIIAGTLTTGDAGIPLLDGAPVDFSLDDDTVYYLWRDSAAYNFADPLQFKYSTSNARWELWDGAAYNEWT